MGLSGEQVDSSQTLMCLRTHWKAFPCKLLGLYTQSFGFRSSGVSLRMPMSGKLLCKPFEKFLLAGGMAQLGKARLTTKKQKFLLRWEMSKRARANRDDEDSSGEVVQPRLHPP